MVKRWFRGSFLNKMVGHSQDLPYKMGVGKTVCKGLKASHFIWSNCKGDIKTIKTELVHLVSLLFHVASCDFGSCCHHLLDQVRTPPS